MNTGTVEDWRDLYPTKDRSNVPHDSHDHDHYILFFHRVTLSGARARGEGPTENVRYLPLWPYGRMTGRLTG